VLCSHEKKTYLYKSNLTIKILFVEILKMIFSICFVIITIELIKGLNSENLNTQDPRGWESICSILSCKSVLDNCIRNNCIGKDNCRNCVLSENQMCVRCVDGLWNEQYFPINGTQTIICDPVNNLHLTTCNFYCRMKESFVWKCEQIGGYPLCNCETYLTNTSTSATTTTSTSTITSTPTTATTKTTRIPFGSLIGKLTRLNKTISFYINSFMQL
jgi:hypothetical protein